MRSSAIILAILLLFSCTAYLPTSYSATDEVRYLGSYWGQRDVREEVAPGDSGARLTIALGSDFKEDSITNIVGTLYLPQVLRSQSITTPSQTESHYLGIVPPGGLFELTFIVNVDESALVGVDYAASLSLSYRVLGGSLRIQTIPVKITVPGRALLEFSLSASEVEPGVLTQVDIVAKNSGTARASDLRVFIQAPTQPTAGLLLGEQPWVVGELPAGASVRKTLRVFASQAAGDTLLPFTVTARYRNTVGAYVDLSSGLSLYVKKPVVSDAIIRVYTEPVKMEPAATQEISIIVENIGRVSVADLRIVAEPAGLPVSLSGQNSWSIDLLAPGEKVVVQAYVSTAQVAANGVYQIPLQASFRDLSGNRLSQVAAITVTVSEVPPKAPNLLIEAEPRIVAGQGQTVPLRIKNIHSSELRRISITSQSAKLGLTIIGSNNWLIDSLRPLEEYSIPVRLYASEELAGASATILVSATYIIGDKGEQASEQREVGFIIEGYITLRVYDVRIIFIGGEPYISGNILNEGISDALFSTITLNSGSGSKTSIFIGEIKPNAPLPFNLKVNSQDDRVRGSIIIEYKDVFRRNYTKAFDVDIEAPKQTTVTRQESEQGWIFPASVASLLAVAAVVAYAFRRRRRRREHS
ncbi:MAG: hypothetical protein QXO86_00830 [Nitrososphaerota archaeon]